MKLVPEGDALAFAVEDGRVRFTVLRLHGHQMVEIASRPG